MDTEGQLRNLRDFLLVYNRMTEACFQRCASNFNYRSLTMDEDHCLNNCAGKLIRSNHRLMGTYVKLMPAMVQRRMEELESKAAEAAKAAESIVPAEPLAASLNTPETPSIATTKLPSMSFSTTSEVQTPILVAEQGVTTAIREPSSSLAPATSSTTVTDMPSTSSSVPLVGRTETIK